ncbi:hypothetical protein C4M98_00350 [Mycoplasmopsis pullorum]|uniref:hypothetical protein n=1 Tax=Mycoplasmopsis pullorum TaxID=48003 RepID=UPI0011188B06|nr:hypothetical protein [Mycoplasmopsis pullorum]TNK82618.1 hypothetical protein C4M94_00350 [Mycoplasmopsis pullorum]TNK83517.1 hypothetical protein C4M80_00175 [Mycoplasmopsis pullorum]TNK84925.1 hypothetical protein C4M81_00765 [Mycoplasmopsis pullorum]TNK85717.1 hypothetical protein C4M92_00290 [Mycoplasmopsis pullorum]TNK86911.1 hypothetical protein C4M82_01780 [Mycoplasmopsis pullorum]
MKKWKLINYIVLGSATALPIMISAACGPTKKEETIDPQLLEIKQLFETADQNLKEIINEYLNKSSYLNPKKQANKYNNFLVLFYGKDIDENLVEPQNNLISLYQKLIQLTNEIEFAGKNELIQNFNEKLIEGNYLHNINSLNSIINKYNGTYRSNSFLKNIISDALNHKPVLDQKWQENIEKYQNQIEVDIFHEEEFEDNHEHHGGDEHSHEHDEIEVHEEDDEQHGHSHALTNLLSEIQENNESLLRKQFNKSLWLANVENLENIDLKNQIIQLIEQIDNIINNILEDSFEEMIDTLHEKSKLIVANIDKIAEIKKVN